MIAVLTGHITVDGEGVGAAEVARFSVNGEGATIHTDGEAMILVMTGEPIDEPVVGYGPFVMPSETEIRTANDDFNSGRFGTTAVCRSDEHTSELQSLMRTSYAVFSLKKITY